MLPDHKTKLEKRYVVFDWGFFPSFFSAPCPVVLCSICGNIIWAFNIIGGSHGVFLLGHSDWSVLISTLSSQLSISHLQEGSLMEILASSLGKTMKTWKQFLYCHNGFNCWCNSEKPLPISESHSAYVGSHMHSVWEECNVCARLIHWPRGRTCRKKVVFGTEVQISDSWNTSVITVCLRKCTKSRGTSVSVCKLLHMLEDVPLGESH